ncbi:MAG: aldehyde dehydrogenase family protein [Pseudomonadota bacterium]
MSEQRLAVAKTYKLFIGGKFPRTESGRYIAFESSTGEFVANVSRASRKDLRNAVVAARAALSGWCAANAYLRGQILYRIAEMVESRQAQFVDELMREGMTRDAAQYDVQRSVDWLVHYAGWSDKYMQILSAVNPVASQHFCFTVPEPVGVVTAIAPRSGGLFGLVSVLAPTIVGGNTLIVIADAAHPLTSVALAEALHASDVPAGVANMLTGRRDELLPQAVSHDDIDALLSADLTDDEWQLAQEQGADHLQRQPQLPTSAIRAPGDDGLEAIACLQEMKTTWHPAAQ